MCKLSTANSFGRRQEDTINLDKRTDTVVCSTCCDSKNICNREGCGKPRMYIYPAIGLFSVIINGLT